ncbi:hypothetical protein A8139_09745 [Marinomonas primoryensis]|uniref:Uncharacterized protein n=1 Tax=Marinomonas primoryensis TaxID=178399 RepID=A0A2Z4PS15_9GAMM|nr:hypothetical protein A8139_09745 [Marinomonas primoryensis]
MACLFAFSTTSLKSMQHFIFCWLSLLFADIKKAVVVFSYHGFFYVDRLWLQLFFLSDVLKVQPLK